MTYGPKPRPVMERIVARSHLEPNGCRVWDGSRDQNGYGKIKADRRMRFVHVVAYEAMVGPVPPGMELDHLCRNHACWEPLHLEPVTHRVNILRGDTLPARNARKTRCKHGHEFTPQNTYIAPDGSRDCRRCRAGAARRFRARRKVAA